MIRFIKHAVADPRANNWTALTYLIPEGWSLQEQLYWLFEDITSPVRFFTKLSRPDGLQAYEALPVYRSSYSHNPNLGTSGYPPPNSVVDGLQWVISQVRPNLRYNVSKMGVLKSSNNVQPGYDTHSSTTSASAWVRIEYVLNNAVFEEEFCGTFTSTTTYMGSNYSPYTSIIWGLYDMHAYRGVKGQLDEARKIGMTISNSFRLDPHWFEYYLEVVKVGVQGFFSNLESQRRLSATILQHNRQISEASQAAFNERMASQDRINEQFRDVLGGVERYYDPKSRTEVQLPLGYANAWVNAAGDTYLVSDIAGYNPNQQTQLATQGWQEIQKKQYR
jgi:hypothetical protein